MTDRSDILGTLDDEPEVLKAVSTPPKKAKAVPSPVAEHRTCIVLDDIDEIPPSGQFFGADGVGYLLRPGEEAMVPDSILSILDTCVVSAPIVDRGTLQVIGTRDRLRFPYRIVRPKKQEA